MVASSQSSDRAPESVSLSARLGSWVVEGMLPFFKVVLLLNVVTFTVAALTTTNLSLLHVLVLPSVAGVVYAAYDVYRRVNEWHHLRGHGSTVATAVVTASVLVIQYFSLLA